VKRKIPPMSSEPMKPPPKRGGPLPPDIVVPRKTASAPPASPARRELVVEKSGQIRQAGASQTNGVWVEAKRKLYEGSLYQFARVILDYHWLSPKLHVPVCRWLQTCPPYRKFFLSPRGHGKSTLTAQAAPLHMIIQPAAQNIYLPNGLAQQPRIPGTDMMILIVGERLDRAQDNFRPIQTALEENQLLRGFWPHAVWENPRRQAKKWNDSEMILPRSREFTDPSFRAVGIGASITGSHPVVMIFDDLTTDQAANSPPEMQKAIEWSKNATALLFDQEKGLIFYTGTRWAVADLPDYRMQNSPEIQFNTKWRSMVEDGEIIYPEKFGYEGAIASLQAEHGVMFPLLYMNSIGDSTLTDFSESDLRFYTLEGGEIEFEETDLDAKLVVDMNMPARKTQIDELRGQPLDAMSYALLRRNNFRVRGNNFRVRGST
jgi:hypothetical protein